jgi:integrase
MTKRPQYCDGIGIFKGSSSTTVWIKLRLPRGGVYRGRNIPRNGSVEHKLGNRASWDWAQLIAERDRLQGLADRGEPLEAVEVQTFGTYALDWLERKRPTLKGYDVTSGHIRRTLNPFFGKKALNSITVVDLNRWISQQSASLKPATVQRQLATFNAIMNDAVKSGVIDRNPSDRADKLKGIEARQRFVTNAEWLLILETADRIEREQQDNKERTPQQIRGWLRHYVSWAYNSGMRRAEILALNWDDVRDLDDDTTVVEVDNTKTAKPRYVTCTDEMRTIIESLKQIERAEGDQRLFPVSLTTLKRSLTRLWKATGLQDVRLHDLRRTHATMLIQRNVDPRTVAGRLGHSGTAMLATRYAVNLGDMEAAKAFGRPLEPLFAD